MIRKATAIWKGGPLAGEGKLYTESGTVDGAVYAIGTPLVDGLCTSPCELLAAAVGGCLASMVAAELAAIHHSPIEIETKTEVSLERSPDWKVTGVKIAVHGTAKDLNDETFATIVERARQKCPIASLLKTEPVVTAQLAAVAAHH